MCINFCDPTYRFNIFWFRGLSQRYPRGYWRIPQAFNFPHHCQAFATSGIITQSKLMLRDFLSGHSLAFSSLIFASFSTVCSSSLHTKHPFEIFEAIQTIGLLPVTPLCPSTQLTAFLSKQNLATICRNKSLHSIPAYLCLSLLSQTSQTDSVSSHPLPMLTALQRV